MIRTIFLSICLVWPQLNEAIVIRHDAEDAEYQLLGEQFNGIVTFQNSFGGVAGMGTLISDRWVLTAAHVANGLDKGDIAKVDGECITIEAVIKHPDWKWEASFFV